MRQGRLRRVFSARDICCRFKILHRGRRSILHQRVSVSGIRGTRGPVNIGQATDRTLGLRTNSSL